MSFLQTLTSRLDRQQLATSVPDKELASQQRITPMIGYGLFLKDMEAYNPDALIRRKGLSVIDEMMRDDQVKASLTLKQTAPISGGWTIEAASENPRHITQRDFIYHCFERIPGTFTRVLKDLMDALAYGFSVLEKVLEKEERGPWRGKLVPRKLPPIAPHNISWVYNDVLKDVVGIEQGVGSSEVIPVWKAVVFRWDSKWGNPWGQSDLVSAYRAWYSKDWTIRHWNIHLERNALQRLVVKYQDGQASKATEMVDEWVEAIGMAIPEGIEVDFPSGGSDAKATSDTFAKAIEVHDQAIARSILKQTLAQGEGQRVGSLAMARVHQDTLMMELASLQQELEDVVNDQLIRFLIDLNFPAPDAYPTFHLPDLFPEDAVEFIKAYTELLKAGGIVVTKADEDRIRDLANLPYREGEDAPPGPSKSGGGGGFPPTGFEHVDEEHAHYAARALTQSEKRLDFERIKNRLDDLEQSALGQMLEVMEQIQEKVLGDVTRRFFKDGLANASEVHKLKVPYLGSVARIFKGFGEQLLDAGSEDLMASVKRAEGFAAVNPGGLSLKQQISAFKANWAAKSTGIATDIGDELARDVRNVLLKAMQNGETQAETTLKLKRLFEKWQVGSTVRGGAFNPWRLETIIRTNFTNAYAQGRLIASRDPDLKGFIQAYQYSAILDERTSDICDSLDGLVLPADDPMVDRIVPPNHFNCRGVLVEVVKGEDFKLSTDRQAASAAASVPDSFK